jgi:FKBP-type peptidyl-prolyl cis-trans isomerase FkpA
MKKLFFLFLVATLAFSCKKSSVDQEKNDKETIHKYLSDHHIIADSTTSGLYYAIKDSGVGSNPNGRSYVTVYYKGYFTDSTVFDQTNGTTRSFFLNQVIPAWTIGVPLIKKGGKISLFVPSSLGYGSHGSGAVPPNTVILFDIELVNFQ